MSRLLFAVLLLSCMSLATAADINPREYRLFKSWGLQADTSGRLHYRPQMPTRTPPNTASASGWQPDLTPYTRLPTIPPSESLQPVVISAKQK